MNTTSAQSGTSENPQARGRLRPTVSPTMITERELKQVGARECDRRDAGGFHSRAVAVALELAALGRGYSRRPGTSR